MKIQNGISLAPLSPEAKQARVENELRGAAKMYETYFLNQMVKAMRSTVDRDHGVMKQNFAEQIFTEQLDQKYVDSWSDRGGVGLADMIYNQIAERFLGGAQKAGHLRGVIPLKNHGQDSIQMKSLPTQQGAKLEYRFEVPNSSGTPNEVLAPMSGQVVKSETLNDGWHLVQLDHGRGMRSELTFPGQRATFMSGDRVESGRRLGLLDPGRPVMAWKLDQT